MQSDRSRGAEQPQPGMLARLFAEKALSQTLSTCLSTSSKLFRALDANT